MPYDPLALPAGSLCHSVIVERVSTVQDDAGQPVANWLPVRTTRASIEAVTGREVFHNQQLASQLTHTIKMRWSPVVIAPGMRVRFGIKLYEIQSVENVSERNRVLKLLTLAINEES